MMTYIPPAECRGLQIERTDMSWSRTSLAFAVNAGLLALNQHMPDSAWLLYSLVAVATLMLIFTLLMAHRRCRTLAQRPLPEPLADPVPIILLTAGTLLLSVILLVSIAI